MNVAQIAAEVVELIRAEWEPLEPMGRRILANRIAEAIRPWLPPPKEQGGTLGPMTPDEAARFEQDSLPFGRYGGVPLGEVPLEYLEWLADESRRTWRNLHRYLNSDRVKRERRSDDEGA